MASLLCRNFDALYATMRVGGGSGPVVLNGPNRNNSGTPIQHGMHAAGAPGQHDTLQASRSLTKSTEAQQQGGLPSAAQIMRILILGLQSSLEQYLPHLSPATCQQVHLLSPPFTVSCVQTSCFVGFSIAHDGLQIWLLLRLCMRHHFLKSPE